MAAGSSGGVIASGRSSGALSLPQKSAPVAGRRRAFWRAGCRVAALRRRGVLMLARSCVRLLEVVGEHGVRMDSERDAQLPAVEIGERARLRQHEVGNAP